MKTYNFKYRCQEKNDDKTNDVCVKNITLRKLKHLFWQAIRSMEKDDKILDFIEITDCNKTEGTFFFPNTANYIWLSAIENPLSRTAIEKLFQSGAKYINNKQN